jgi:class 3 adenylate cyclase
MGGPREGPGSLVGRRPELSWLRGRLDLATRGYPHLVLVEGEAGIGKTRLVHELLGEARQASTTVVRGRCYEHLDLAYLPLRESLFTALADSIAGQADRETDRWLLERVSAAAPRDETHADEADAAERTRQLFTLTRLVIDFAQSAPTIVFVDDLDWADDATVDLLRHLLFRFDDENVALLLLATTRGDPHARAADGVAKLRAELRSATLSLHPLSAMEATELAHEQRAGMPVEQARQYAVAGGGNPLLIEALTRPGPTGPGTRSRTTGASHPMMSAIEARLDALSADARQLVRVAAFLVPDCTPALLAEVTELKPAALRVARNEAVEQGVLVEDGVTLAFAHPLYAHIAYTQTTIPARRAIHARAATTLLVQRDDGEPVSVRAIAHHLAGAGQDADPAVVAEYARRAGDEALAIAAWAEAAGHYETALAASGPATDPLSLAALHRLAGLSLRGNLELARAVRHFDSAIQCLGPNADDEALAELQMWRIRCGIGTHELLDVVRDRRPLEGLVAAIEATNPALAAEALVELSQSYWVDAQMDESEKAARRAMALAIGCGNHEAHARAAMSLSVPQWARYELSESLTSLEAGASEALLSDDASALAGGPAFRVPLVLAWLGRLDDAEARAQECCVRAERINYPLEEGLPLAALALVAVTRGDFDRAEHHAHRALLVQRLSGYHWAAGLFLPALFSACIARGRYEAASDALDTWSETANPLELATIALFRRYAAALERGLPVQGDRLPPLPRRPMVGADSWAVAHIEIARREGSAVDVSRAHDLLEQMEQRGGLVVNHLGALMPRLRGVAADLVGNEDEAIVVLRHAITVARDLRAEPEHARALVDVATILLRRGERREAFALLDDAIERFDRLGMVPDAERASRFGGDGTPRAARRQPGRAGHAESDTTTTRSVILFSDVVESTRLTEELGTVRYRERARRLEDMITASFSAHGGTIVSGINLGDGFIGLFPAIGSAISAARQCASQAGSTGLHLHLGLHAGEIIVDGPRIYGGPVNYAARLCSLTGPDEILVSAAIRDSATGLPGVAFVDRGQHSLKGIAGPQRLYALVGPDTVES